MRRASSIKIVHYDASTLFLEDIREIFEILTTPDDTPYFVIDDFTFESIDEFFDRYDRKVIKNMNIESKDNRITIRFRRWGSSIIYYPSYDKSLRAFHDCNEVLMSCRSSLWIFYRWNTLLILTFFSFIDTFVQFSYVELFSIISSVILFIFVILNARGKSLLIISKKSSWNNIAERNRDLIIAILSAILSVVATIIATKYFP